jgi:hypothetical protein
MNTPHNNMCNIAFSLPFLFKITTMKVDLIQQRKTKKKKKRKQQIIGMKKKMGDKYERKET